MFAAGFSFVFGAIAAIVLIIAIIAASPILLSIAGIGLFAALAIWLAFVGIDVTMTIINNVSTNWGSYWPNIFYLGMFALLYFGINGAEKLLPKTNWFNIIDKKTSGHGCFTLILIPIILVLVIVFMIAFRKYP